MTRVCAHCSRGEGALLSCVCGEAAYCGRECQRLDWARHKPSCPPYVLKDSGQKGKGLGLFATRNLPAFKALMVTPNRGKEGLLVPVFLPANDTEAKIQDRKLKQLEASGSLNHSCNANCVWRAEEGNMSTLMTLVSVKKGEELTTNYYFADDKHCCNHGQFCLPYQERKRIIADLYGFNCLCEECSRGGEDDHLRRQYEKQNLEVEKNLCELGKLEIDSILGLLKTAEAKLELGRKLDNQLLSRDLTHCLSLFMYLRNIAPEPMVNEYREKFDRMNEELQMALKMYPKMWRQMAKEQTAGDPEKWRKMFEDGSWFRNLSSL